MAAPYRNKNAEGEHGQRVKRKRIAVNLSLSEYGNRLLQLVVKSLTKQGVEPTDDEIKSVVSTWCYAHIAQRASPEYQEIEAQLKQAIKERDDARIDAEIEVEQYTRIATDWNELCQMLDRELGVKVYSDELTKDADGNRQCLWTIEHQGVISKGHPTVADVYATVLKARS